MKLGDFENVDFGGYEDYELEDVSTFFQEINHSIDVLDFGVYVYKAKEYSAESYSPLKFKISKDLLHDYFRLLQDNAGNVIQLGVTNAIVSTETILENIKSPNSYSPGALNSFSRYMNFHLISTLTKAAQKAASNSTHIAIGSTLRRRSNKIIKLPDIEAVCKDLPYPMNKFFC